MADIAEATAAILAADLTGRAIERIVVDDERWIADQITTGVPEQPARLVLTWYRAARAGYVAEPGPLPAELLGREPRTVADRLAAHIAAGS